MKRLLLFTTVTIFLFIAASAAWYVSKLHKKNKTISYIALPAFNNKKLKEKLGSMALTAKQFTKTNNFNTQICFFIDMSIESGKKRFFVYDLKKDTILLAGLVTHGCCNQNFLTTIKYGNTIGCGCTSPGKYKIGTAYYGRFGLAYKLYGLDASNSNAYARFVVLHSMQCVPEGEVHPYPICQSNGCPTVSPGFIKELAPVINASNHPILLWIFN